MAYQIITIDESAGDVEIKIHIGYAHWGEFSFDIYNEQGCNPKRIFKGINSDTIPDEFNISNPHELNGHFMQCKLRAVQHQPEEGALYYVQVLIMQGGKVLHAIQAQGKFTQQVQSFSKIIKFEVA